MKKLLAAILLIPSLAFCDTKISNLTPATTMAQTDVVPIVINPGTTPANRIITLQNLSGSIISTITANSLGVLTLSSAAATYVNKNQAGSGGGSGIVSPGTFTWTNNFGIAVSTIVASSTATFTTVIASSQSVLGQLTVGGPIVGNGAYLQNVPIMSPNGTAPFPGPTPGYLDITQYYNTLPSSSGGGYKISNTLTLNRAGSTLVVGSNNAGSSVNSTCVGDSACNHLGSSATHSTVIGNSALQTDVSGEENTAIGYQAGFNTTTNREVFIGAFAGAGDTTGNQNVAIGWDAMPLNDVGSGNVCVGNNACDLLQGGSENTIVGNVSGADITTGIRNTCLGSGTSAVQPCSGIITGSSNTAVGNGSLGNISFTGNEHANTTIGFLSSVNQNVNESVAIGYNAVAPSSFTMQLGGTGVDAVRVIASTITVSSMSVTSLTNGQCVQAGVGGQLTTTGSACGSGGGSGVTVYPATATASFPFGLSASTIAVNSSGDASIIGTIGGTSYNTTWSSTTATNTVGQCAIFSGTNTVIGQTCGTGGGGTPGGSNAQFQYNNSGSFAGTPLATVDASSISFNSISSMTYIGFSSMVFQNGTALDVSSGTLYVSTLTFNNGAFFQTLSTGLQITSSATITGQVTVTTTTFNAFTFSSLGAASNGTFEYCSDCTVTTPATCVGVISAACVCTGSGTGAFAKRLNGTWYCN